MRTGKPTESRYVLNTVTPEEPSPGRRPVPVGKPKEERKLRPWTKWLTRFALGAVLVGAGAGINSYINDSQRILNGIAENNGISQDISKGFYKKYPEMAKNLLEENRTALVPAMEMYGQNATLFDSIYNSSTRDSQITMNKYQVAASTSEAVLAMNPLNQNLGKKGQWTLGNLTLAYKQEGLPKLSKEATERFVNASMKSEDLTDFSPIVLKNVRYIDIDDGLEMVGGINNYRKLYFDYLRDNPDALIKDGDVVIGSENMARDYWTIGKLIQNHPEIANNTEQHEWVNRFVQQLNWDLFDSPFNLAWYDGYEVNQHNYTEREVWNAFEGVFNYYNQLPGRLESDGIIEEFGHIFPYYNSTLLKEYIPDKVNRTMALNYLFTIPPETIDRVNLERIRGLEAIQKYPELMKRDYESILEFYKNKNLLLPIVEYDKLENGTIIEIETGRYGLGHYYPKIDYYGLLFDRAGHGWNKTIGEFVGIDNWKDFFMNSSEISNKYDFKEEADKFLKEEESLIYRNDGVHQELSRIWKPWNFTCYITGHNRMSPLGYIGEDDNTNFGIKLSYNAFGIPSSHLTTEDTLTWKGGGGGDHATFIPTEIVEQIKNKFPEEQLAIGYGNFIGIQSSTKGLYEDGLKELRQSTYDNYYTGIEPKFLRGVQIYLWDKN